MSSLSQIVSSLIRWALVLAGIGFLGNVTLHVMADAAAESQRGLVSLGRLNRQLLGTEKQRHKAIHRSR